MYSTSAPYPREAIGDDMTPLMPAKAPEPHVTQETLCARKVPVFPNTTPVPRPGVTGQPYIRLLARVNGLVQDIPAGMLIDPCLLPAVSSPGGTQVTIVSGQTPSLNNDSSIPNQQIGVEDSALLATPTRGFKQIVVNGEAVLVPDYSGDVA